MTEIKLLHGDCLEQHQHIESGSVDLILTDLPYGIMKGIGSNVEDYKNLRESEWDVAIDSIKIHEIANRILRKNGKIILFSQEPLTSELIGKAISNVPFCYRMIWEKDHFANALNAKKNPVSYFEDILVFKKMNPVSDIEFKHPLRPYFKYVLDFIGINLKQINAKLGHRKAEHTFYVTPKQAIIKEIGQKADHSTRIGSSQFALCTEKTYNELIEAFGIDKMQGFKNFEELKEIDRPFKSKLNDDFNNINPSTFNLWEDRKYKSNILKYKKDYNGYHPTQKPVLLLEDLIKTFSNAGDLVVDLTMGSGSTGVACRNTGRAFIGIEREESYFRIAEKRMNQPIQDRIFGAE